MSRRGWVTKSELADLLRAAAAGAQVDGDPGRARVLRTGARRMERRDGAGESGRKHVRTRT